MTANANADTFSWDQHFWSEDDRSYQTLEKMSDMSCDIMSLFGEWLAERSDAEEQYAKRLRKLHEVPTGGILRAAPEGLTNILNLEFCRTMRETFEGVREECKQEASAHKDLSVHLQQLLVELKDFSKEQKRLRKQVLNEATICLKERGKCEANMRKARGAYSECVTKAEAAQSSLDFANTQSRPKSEIDKATQKVQKLAKDEMLLDQEYKEAVQQWQEYHPAWVDCFTTFMLTMQQQEEQRVDFLKAQLCSIALQLQQMTPPVSEARQRLTNLCRSINRDGDLAEWVTANRTGDAPAPPPQYIPKSARSKLSEAVIVSPIQLAPAAVSAESLSRESSDLSSAGGSPLLAPRVAATAMYDFIGDEADEIDFFTGERVEVIHGPSWGPGWWVGSSHGRTGWFPSTYVEEVRPPSSGDDLSSMSDTSIPPSP